MKGKLLFGLFVCMVVAQIATPLSMILQREIVLKDGVLLKFKTAPVDPFDAFRGRYVALRMDQNTLPVPPGRLLHRGQTVYVPISVGADGFAVLATILTHRPTGMVYLECKVGHVINEGDLGGARQGFKSSTVRLDLPFDRYYMEEKAAPVAERIYRRRTAGGRREAYILVRVKDGMAVIQALYVGGRPIEEAVRRETEKRAGRTVQEMSRGPAW